MSAWLAVGILSGFAAAGGVVRVCVELARRLRSGTGMEPENSLQGRVMPPGVPLVRALKASRDAISDLGDRTPPRDGPPTGGVVQETRRGRFSEGQWLRRKVDGRLMMCIGRSCEPGHFWAAWEPSAEIIPGLCSDLDFEAAVPGVGEWWRITEPCGRDSRPSVPAAQVMIDGPICGACAWEPVNFGLGHAESASTPSAPIKGHFKVAVCLYCGEVLGVVENAGRGALFTHCRVSTYWVWIEALTRPMAGEGWRLDSCVKGHRLPEDLPDLSKTGDYGYDEAGMFFAVKADWATGLGVAESLLCGCLRPVPGVTDPEMTGNTKDRRDA